MNLLNGIKVIDLSSVLAGPSVGSFLAELGADVIKLENPKGDVTRGWKLPSEQTDAPVSAYYASVNYRKKIAHLDLRNPDELKRLHQYIREADVLLDNFKASDLIKFGLTSDDTKALNPRLIHCHLAGFKFETERVAYDVVLQAETGFMFMNGEKGGVKMPVAMMDVLAAHQMKEAVLLALYQREKTGKGAYIHATLEEAGISSLVNQGANYLMAGHVPQPMGSKHPNIAPYGDIFPCNDGKDIVLAIGSEKQFQLFVDHIGLSELAKDNRFHSNGERVKNREALCEALAKGIQQHSSVPLLSWCHENKVPAGAIKNLEDVAKNPTAQSMIREEEIEGVATRRFSSVAFSIEPF